MEHLSFKGTHPYPTTRALSEAVEGLGGTFNASTDRESTVYYVRVPTRHAATAMEVLGELVVRPNLDEAEIENERDVIVEEIRSYLDDPAEHVNVLFDLAMFDDTPLGREIAGSEEGVRALPAAAIHEFWRAHYRPSNVVIAASGDLAHDRVVELAAAAFGTGVGSPPGYLPAPPIPAGMRSLRATRPATQAQLVVGVPAPPRDHPDQWTLSVLNAVLGDGMSSRLFLEVREERGLAYDVGSSTVEYSDAGVLSVYAGVDPGRIRPTITAVLAELARLRDEDVPDQEMAKVKAYLAGRLELCFQPFSLREAARAWLQEPSGTLMVRPDGKVPVAAALSFICADVRRDGLAGAWDSYREACASAEVGRAMAALICKDLPVIV